MRLTYHFRDAELYRAASEVLAWAWSGHYNLNEPVYYVSGFLTARDAVVEVA